MQTLWLRYTVLGDKGHPRVSHTKLRSYSASPKASWWWSPQCISSSLSSALWSYVKFTAAAGTNEEGLRVWETGTKGNRAVAVARSTLNAGIGYRARTAGRASLTCAPEISSWATRQIETSGGRGFCDLTQRATWRLRPYVLPLQKNTGRELTERSTTVLMAFSFLLMKSSSCKTRRHRDEANLPA